MSSSHEPPQPGFFDEMVNEAPAELQARIREAVARNAGMLEMLGLFKELVIAVPHKGEILGRYLINHWNLQGKTKGAGRRRYRRRQR